jgi:hypothetical protein
MIRAIAGLIAAIFFTSPANADFLFERAGGAAYYDWQQDITWLTDANYSATSGTDPQFGQDGLMSWDNAVLWIDILNASYHLGINVWRMPRLVDFANDGINQHQCVGYSYTDQGEMTFLYFKILDGTYIVDCEGNTTPHGLPDTGPFINVNLDETRAYFYGQEYAPNPTIVWVLHMEYGGQHADGKVGQGPVWPVFDGDLLYTVGDPLPAAVGVDVFPFNPEKVIDPEVDEPITVMILGTAEIDANVIDRDSIRFAPGDLTDADMRLARLDGDPVITDLNGDLISDMGANFQNLETGIGCDDTEVTIYGETIDDEPFVGTDTIVTTACEPVGCHP